MYEEKNNICGIIHFMISFDNWFSPYTTLYPTFFSCKVQADQRFHRHSRQANHSDWIVAFSNIRKSCATHLDKIASLKLSVRLNSCRNDTSSLSWSEWDIITTTSFVCNQNTLDWGIITISISDLIDFRRLNDFVTWWLAFSISLLVTKFAFICYKSCWS